MLFVNTKSVRNLLKQKAFLKGLKKARHIVDSAKERPCPGAACGEDADG